MAEIDFYLEAKRLEEKLDREGAIYACNDGQTGFIGDEGIKIIEDAMHRIYDLANGKLAS